MKMALKSCTISNVIFTPCLSRKIVLAQKSHHDFDFGFSRSYNIVCSQENKWFSHFLKLHPIVISLKWRSDKLASLSKDSSMRKMFSKMRWFQKCTEMFLKAHWKASLEIAHICIHGDWMGLYSSEIAHLHAYWFNGK